MSLHLTSSAFTATGWASAGVPAARTITPKTTGNARCIRTSPDRDWQRRRLSHKGQHKQTGNTDRCAWTDPGRGHATIGTPQETAARPSHGYTSPHRAAHDLECSDRNRLDNLPC